MKNLLVVLVVALLGWSVPAAAKGNAHARQLYEKGEAAYQVGNFAEAVTLFEQAYAESKLPPLLWNIARAHRRQYDLDHDLTHLRRARAVYENYSAMATDEKSRGDAEHEMGVLKALIDEAEHGKSVKATATVEMPGTTPTPDDFEGTTPATTSPTAKPPATTLVATTPPPKKPTPVAVVPPPPAPLPLVPPEEPPPPKKSHAPLIAGIVVGAAVVVGAVIVIGVVASSGPSAPAAAGHVYPVSF